MHGGDGHHTIARTLLLTLLVCITLASATVGWVIDERISPSVAVAVIIFPLLTSVACAALRRAGILTIDVALPNWLRRIDVAAEAPTRLDDETRRALDRSVIEARHFHQREVRTEHTLLALVQEPCHAARALAVGGVTVERLIRAVDLIAGIGTAPDDAIPELGAGARRVLTEAGIIAQQGRTRSIGTGHLLLALTETSAGSAAGILDHLGCTRTTLERALKGTQRREQ